MVTPSSGDVIVRRGGVPSTAGEGVVTTVVEGEAGKVGPVVVVEIGVVDAVDEVGSSTVGSTTRAKPTADPRISTTATQAGRRTTASRRPRPGSEVRSASRSGAPSTEALRFSAARKEAEEVTEVTEPKDTTPPELRILHPVDGQIFDTTDVVFEGVTEPGARVFAGPYEADVNDEGGWRIVLILSSGSNHATLKATDAAGNVSQASVSVIYAPPQEPPKEAEEPKGWEFSAHQVYGECSENHPIRCLLRNGQTRLPDSHRLRIRCQPNRGQ
jgi:hypothetical protein